MISLLNSHSASSTQKEDNELVDSKSETIQDDSETNLLAKIQKLETENHDALQHAERRVIISELKVEAIRTGMIDLDGLTFLDLTQVHLDENGNLSEAAELIIKLKQSKPWLFTTPSTSSIAEVPPSRPSRQKLATEMTDGEYRIARANIIRRSTI
jgi:hypothetical protein